ncbi:MAG TPA: hypothetical protein VJQ07_12050 [Gaiellaceae bacterium]|jgi:hypothetical protein|nr:hypothetical protein [Gaiellaceae bacterium]
MRVGVKLMLTAAGVVIGGVLIGFYVSTLTTLQGSASYTGPVQSVGGKPVVNLKIETVAAVGPKLSPNFPDWVSYLVQNEQGKWVRRTVWKLPANATVHVTIYNFDGASGLRNPYLARAEGVDGNRISIDGKTTGAIDPNDASHTFAVPAYHLIVALPGVGDNAKNQCGYAPCSLSMAHRTIKFTFRTGAPGHYRWQCFVPCAAGWVYGFGGPMQTIGYMDGFLDVA